MPDHLHTHMANLAQLWHWPPGDMWAMTVPELLHWHSEALERNKPR